MKYLMRLEGDVMLKEFAIYLAGGMGKFGKDNFDKGNTWRKYCKHILEHFDGSKYSINVINPNDYFNFKDESPVYKTQKEVMEFDLNKVRHCDLLIVNFNDVYSLGSMAELAIAYEKRIPIVGINTDNQQLHTWQNEMCNRIFNNIDETLDYVKYFYLR